MGKHSTNQIFASLLLFLAFSLHATDLQRQVFARFTAFNPIKNLPTTSIAQDHTGAIWIGTQHGLFRMHGNEQSVFRADPTDPYTLSADWVTALLVDSSGTLWVGTRYAGLNRFDEKTERFSKIELPARHNKSNTAEVSVLHQDASGQIWVGSYGSGLYRWDAENNLLQPVELPEIVNGVSTLHLNDVIADDKGHLWLAAGTTPLRTMPAEMSGLIHWDPATNQLQGFSHTQNGRPLGSINRLKFDHQGTLRLASFRSGLLSYSATDNTVIQPQQPIALMNAQLTDIATDEQGGLWVASFSNGLWYLPPDGARWDHFRYSTAFSAGLASDSINQLFFDNQHTLWVITQNRMQSLNRFSRHIRTLPRLDKSPGTLRSADILAIDAVDKNKVWLGNRTGGLLQFNPQTSELLQYESPAGFSDMAVRQVLQHGSSLWVGSDRGLWQFDPSQNQWQLFPLQDIANQPVIIALYLDQQQRLWAGTRGHGVFLISNQRIIRHFDQQSKPAIGFNDSSVILQDRFGAIWLGSSGQGLTRLDPDLNHAIHWQQADAKQHGLQFNGVQLIVEENQDIWVHSGNTRHLAIRDPQQPQRILGFKPYLQPADIDEKLQKAELFRLLYRTHWLAKANSMVELSENHGVQSVTWIGAWDEHDGILYRGGQEGLDYYPRATLPDDWPLNPIKMVNLALYNQLIQPARPDSMSFLPVVPSELTKLQLQYSQDMFTLHFASAEFVFPTQLQYRYQLAGFDRDWINGALPMATYTRLPPGTYQFNAQARIQNGPWQQAATLPVVILPPWWMTWWFRALVVASLLVLIYGWYRQNMRRQLLMRQKLEQQVTLRTDELRQRTLQLEDKHQALQLSYQNMALLQQIGSEITASLDLQQVLTRCHDHVSKILDAHVLLIGIYRETEHVLDFAFWIENNHLAPRFTIELTNTDVPSVVCFTQQREIIVSRVEDFLRYLPAIPSPLYGELTRSVLYFPLTINGKPVGVFSVQSLQEQAYQAAQIDLMRTLASYVAISVANADSYEQLQQTQQKLITQEKMASLGALVAGVAHEINTPLGVCVTATSHLQVEYEQIAEATNNKTLAQSQFQRFMQHLAEGLKILQVNTTRASDLIQSFKQVSVDQSNVALREFDLRSYMQDVLLTLRPKLNKTGCRLDFRCPEQVTMFTDPGALAQIVTNLVFNALLHGLDKHPHPEIYLHFSVDSRMICLQFGDNGCGMEPRALSHIFEPFFTTKRNEGGTGLGTHIVFNLVTASLKGQIETHSKPGEGLHYTMTFPIRRDN